MPKVLMVGQDIDPSPPFAEAVKNQCRALAGKLLQDGWTVSYVSRNRRVRRGQMVYRLDGMTVLCVPNSSNRLKARAWSGFALSAILAWLRPDIVHFWGAHSLLPVPRRGLAAKPSRLVVTLYRPISGAREQRLLTKMADWPLDIVVEHASIASGLQGTGLEPIAVIPPGVDVHRLGRRRRPADRRTWFAFFASAPIAKGGADEERYLESRGVHLGLELGRRIAAQLPFQQLLLWRTAVSPRVRDLIGRYPSATVVQSIIPDLADYVGRFDLCWILSDASSLSKTIPLSAIEALGRGIPLVLRLDSPLAEAVVGAGAGFAVDPADLDLSASEIVALLNTPGAYDVMSRNARRLVADQYGLDRMVAAYESVYRGEPCISA